MNILVPTDFSEEAEWGVQAAEIIAKKSNSEVTLINVIHPPYQEEFSATGDVYKKGDYESEAFTAKLIEKNQDRLLQTVRKYSKADRMKGRVVIDYWQEGLKKMVEEHQADLLVMGTTAENTFKEKFVGNNTEKAIRNLDCPVLVFNRAPIGYNADNFLFAIDPSIDLGKSIEKIKTLARELGAKVNYLNLINKTEEVDNRKKSIEEQLKGYGINEPAVTIIADEKLEEGLKKTAEAYQADTIVMLTHGRSGLQSIFTSSKTEKMIRKSELPVLSLNFREVND